MDKQAFGAWGEAQSMYYLRSQSYQILHTNWRYRKAEIDIIAKKESLIVFVEVKTRLYKHQLPVDELISKRKIELFHEVAEHYLEAEGLDLEVRCDVIAICGSPKYFKINHIEDAF